MLYLENLLLQAGGTSGGGMLNFVFLGAMILIFWLFLIRPQSKKQKEQKNFASELKKGDKVVTSSGILGVINKIEDDDIVHLEVGTKMYIKVTKNAISKELTDAVYAAKDQDKK